MISASAAGTHRFGRVKRNGYDPAEVDAVVSRLIETVHAHEVRTEALEKRLSEADVSADAIRRTFVAAEKTKDELLAETAREAAAVLEAARSEAAEVSALAESLGAETAARRERILREASEEAEHLLIAAELTAAETETTAAAHADATLESATEDAAKERHEASMMRRASSMAAAWITRRAHENAQAIVADAAAEASVILRRVDVENEVLRARAVSLQVVVAELEVAAANLATLTSSDRSVIDLKTIEALSPASEPAVAVHHEPPSPLLSVSEARKELDEDSETSLDEQEDPDRPTRYQRITGLPLRERIKIARASS